MTDDRKRKTGGEVGIHHPSNACCFREQCKEMERALAESRADVSGLRAARMAYAGEFPLNADGEPDVGNIHANIRALKARAERLAGALRKVVAISDRKHDAWDEAKAVLNLEPRND